MPLKTEYRIQKAKWHLRNDSTIDGLLKAYGKPNRIILVKGEQPLLNGEKLTLADGEQTWVYNEEGMPYWIFYVVTDGVSIKKYVVDRLW